MAKSKLNASNETIKDEYKKFLKHGRTYKLSEASVKDKISSINMYDEFCKFKDFKLYDYDCAIDFKNYLKNTDRQPKTVISHLNNVKEFLGWYFANHKVPKKKQLDDLRYFDVDDEYKRLANRCEYRKFPSYDEFEKIIDFEEKTLTDKRNKVLLVFLYISAARIDAVVTSTLDRLDTNTMVFNQDPLENVHTKRAKHIVSKLFKFDEKYFDIVRNWVVYLQKQGFSNKDSLFPKIKRLTTGEVLTKDKMNDESECNKIIKIRCQNAGVDEYSPHEFRHGAIYNALKYVRNGRQLKALSQNVGHESIITVLEQYANLPADQYTETIADMFETSNNENKIVCDLNDVELLEILKIRNTGKLF